MTIDTLIMFAGAIVVAVPFLGFPNSWDSVIYVLAGALIIALGIVVRRRGKNLVIHEKKSQPHFLQSSPETEEVRVTHDNETRAL